MNNIFHRFIVLLICWALVTSPSLSLAADLPVLQPIYPEVSFCQFHESFSIRPSGAEKINQWTNTQQGLFNRRTKMTEASNSDRISLQEQSRLELAEFEKQAQQMGEREGRAFFDDLSMVLQLEKLDRFLFEKTQAHSWVEYKNLHKALSLRLGVQYRPALDPKPIKSFLTKLASDNSIAEPIEKQARQLLENVVLAALIHQKRLMAESEQRRSFWLQNLAFLAGGGLIFTSLYLALAGGATIISSPFILVGVIAATGAAGVPLIKNAVSSVGEGYARSQKYGTQMSCEQSEYFKLTSRKQLTEVGVGFGAGLVVGGLISLLPATASLVLAPLMAIYIGYMAYKEFKLAYSNYYGEGGYHQLLELSKKESDERQAILLKDHAHRKLSKAATESAVGLITLGLFVLVVYEGVVFTLKSQNKVLKVQKEKMMQFWARVQEMAGEFQVGGQGAGSRSAKLEAEELSAVLGVEGENIAAMIHGDEEVAMEVAELAKNLGIEQHMGELIQGGDPNQVLSSLLQNISGQGSGSEIFYSELSYYFAKLLELSSNDAAMIAHKMIDKHLAYVDKKDADFSHATELSQEQIQEVKFLAALFGLYDNPAMQAFKKAQ